VDNEKPVTAYIGLGGNLGNGPARLRCAVVSIARLPRTLGSARTPRYQSLPMGSVSQPVFTNAVLAIRTRLSPEDLLAELQKIEQRFGRIRTLRWGPRTLDLDILLYGAATIERPGLCVPHPGIPTRSFVLYPLREIAPRLDIPGMGRPGELIRQYRLAAPRRLRDPGPDRARFSGRNRP